MTRSRGILQRRRHWSEVELELLRHNYADSRTADIAAALGRPADAVYRKAHNLDLRKSDAYLASPEACRLRRGDHVGKEHYFEKGHVPANKGLRRPGYAVGRMRETQFRKGAKPHTWLPIGSTRLTSDGYLEVKVSEGTRDGGTKLFTGWVPVHRVVWVLAGNLVPDDHVVVFKPGRHSTELQAITFDALECITLAANLERNRLPPELQKVSQLRGVLTRAINKRAREA